MPDRRQPPDRPRLILLGASNLSFALPAALTSARAVLGPSVEVLLAVGPGRSYGRPSRVLARTLPGIVECGLWEAAVAHGGDRPTAVITDVGNDIIYGQVPETIAGWIEGCIDRLQDLEARIALTQLPVANIEGLSRWRYEPMRALLFPTHRMPLTLVRERVRVLAGLLGEVARRRGVDLVEMEPSWYGLDPIHVRPSSWGSLWTRIMGRFGGPVDPPAQPAEPVRRHQIAAARPQRRWVFGRLRQTPQPSARLGDGTTLAAY